MTLYAGRCVIGQYCVKHGFIHGAEAEELRQELKKLLEDGIDRKGRLDASDLERLLERVDARDSVAWLEFKGRDTDEDDESAPVAADAPSRCVVPGHVVVFRHRATERTVRLLVRDVREDWGSFCWVRKKDLQPDRRQGSFTGAVSKIVRDDINYTIVRVEGPFPELLKEKT